MNDQTARHHCDRHDHDSDGTVRDPVCGMTVADPGSAPSFEHAGHTHYFCREACRGKFAADPEKYLEGRNERAEPAANFPRHASRQK
jgi:Cu+-exporting ATPase